ncbi:MAG: cytochrome c-type biogenesis protein CcmH [Myxococcales bacterium]|nr:cytochrome c-type biogenesis protein CcmH [Myxococcales bacterium]
MFLLVQAPPAAAAAADAPAGEEARLEARLLAPCCYVQTLDVHDSPMASELRSEVKARLAAGESPSAIEEDFARRFGDRVRALPRNADPRTAMLLFSTACLLAGAAGVALMMRRWRRAESPTTATAGPPDDLDRRIDDELERLDD